MTLTEFLLQRIAEDEETARFDMWDTSNEAEMAAQIGRDAEAKRRIVESMGDDWVTRTLARPYADHPDYRAEWKP